MKNFVNDAVPCNKKEAGMVALHKLDYKTDFVFRELAKTKPMDGSNWTTAEKQTFSKEIFRLRKNMPLLSKALNKSFCNIMTYYLGTFKKSDDYRLLKTVCAQERAQKLADSERGLDACVVCGDGGSLLICDGCEGEYHMTCLRPRLAAVPEGNWECDDCVNRQFLEARDYLIRNTTIYERVEDKKRKVDEIMPEKVDTGSSIHSDASTRVSTRSGGMRKTASSASLRSMDTGGILLRPSSDVLTAVRKLADSISKALSASNLAAQKKSKLEVVRGDTMEVEPKVKMELVGVTGDKKELEASPKVTQKASIEKDTQKKLEHVLHPEEIESKSEPKIETAEVAVQVKT